MSTGSQEPGSEPRLRRALGLPALVVYGVGGMLGGGIYALVGEVAGRAGDLAWVAFLTALAVAAPTALAYAELAGRHARSGGEAHWTREAFGPGTAAFLVGWGVLLSCVVSQAALAHAFAEHVADFAPAAPETAVALAFLAVLAVINLRGIVASSWTNVACTAVEAGGLVAVVAFGARALWGDVDAPAAAEAAAEGSPGALGVLGGAALAFYAFIGFEDMVNVGEEVAEPERAYPRAIPLALAVVGVVYAAVTWTATAVVAPAELAASDAPLARVFARGAPEAPEHLFTLVALFAVANSALINGVTGSRLLHGMAREGLAPALLGRVNERWRTPHAAVGAVLVLAGGLAAAGGLAVLAGATSALLFGVFFAVHLALLRLRARRPEGDLRRGPLPFVGMALSLALVGFLPAASLLTAAGLVAGGALVTLAWRRRAGSAGEDP